jgi:hypothetical protein
MKKIVLMAVLIFISAVSFASGSYTYLFSVKKISSHGKKVNLQKGLHLFDMSVEPNARFKSSALESKSAIVEVTRSEPLPKTLGRADLTIWEEGMHTQQTCYSTQDIHPVLSSSSAKPVNVLMQGPGCNYEP